MTQSESIKKPSEDALIAQLYILNDRSRWYSSQLWQIPFIYFAAIGAVFGSIVGKTRFVVASGSFVVAVMGVFIFLHMLRIRDGERRAVGKLMDTECSLSLASAQYRKDYTNILIVSVALSVGSLFALCLLVWLGALGSLGFYI